MFRQHRRHTHVFSQPESAFITLPPRFSSRPAHHIVFFTPFLFASFINLASTSQFFNNSLVTHSLTFLHPNIFLSSHLPLSLPSVQTSLPPSLSFFSYQEHHQGLNMVLESFVIACCMSFASFCLVILLFFISLSVCFTLINLSYSLLVISFKSPFSFLDKLIIYTLFLQLLFYQHSTAFFSSSSSSSSS